MNRTPKQRPKLLVVDDEPDQCASIKSYFSRRNFLVFSTANGQEALVLIKENKPDLVLLDMKLSGGIDGKEVLRTLRQHDKDTKVALVTGDLLNEKEIKEIVGLGIVEFITKPVDLSTLEGVIKKALKEKYPKAPSLGKITPDENLAETSLRRINHELSNITNDITSKCELYILNTEEGFYRDKTEKDRLDESIEVIKSVLKSTGKLTDLIKKLTILVKREDKH